MILNPCAAKFVVSIFHHFKPELLTQFPALNDEKYPYLMSLCDELIIYHSSTRVEPNVNG